MAGPADATLDAAAEELRLDAVAGVYDPSDPAEEFDWHLKRLHVGVLGPWLHGRRVLEMGCATGELTSLLAPLAEEYHIVEGSAQNVEAARKRVPSATFTHALWEDHSPDRPYSDVLLVCGLEHVEDPVGILRRARTWLEPGGRLHVIVPNADSLHRMVGVELGVLPDRTSLSHSDLRIGHRRVYTLDRLLGDVRAADLDVVTWEGIFLKVLSNAQMLGWDQALVEALHRVGRRFPAHCAELYVLATPAGTGRP
jgi:trans-aconitate methyltransferase